MWLWTLILVTISVLLVKILRVFLVNYDHRPNESPLYQSWTTIGPFELIKNPLEFVRKARDQLKTPIFSSWILGQKIVFVTGKENVLKVTDAKKEILDFGSAYRNFLQMAFGKGILTEHTLDPQVKILVSYLGDSYLNAYLEPTAILARKIIFETLGEKGKTDITQLLLKTSFNVGTRNFLGDDFLEALKVYDYESIFGGFEMGLQFLTEYVPLAGVLKSYLDNFNVFTIRSTFAKVALKLAAQKGGKTNRENMFEEIVYQKHELDGPVEGDEAVMINLLKIFVFGSAFNGYNMMTYFIKSCLVATKPVKSIAVATWQELREEQEKIEEEFGPLMTNGKRAAMEKLYHALMSEMFRNTFPFLLRKTKVDFEVGPYVVPKGQFVAYSPQLEHSGEYIDDQHFNLIFGKGTHLCPAKKYAINSMMIILSILIRNYDLELVEAEPMVNTRLVTFPKQPSIIVKYRRIR